MYGARPFLRADYYCITASTLPTPTSTHTHAGNYSDLNPASNYSFYYEYGPCSGFPTNGQTQTVPVPPGTVDGAAGAGSIPPATVGNLEPSTEYCVRVCMEDETAGGGYICSSNPTSFSTPAAPAVETDPPYYIGKSDQSRPRLLLFTRTRLPTNPPTRHCKSHATPLHFLQATTTGARSAAHTTPSCPGTICRRITYTDLATPSTRRP